MKKYLDKPYKYPIDVEISSRCMLNCVGCIHGKRKDLGDMSVETFKKVLNFVTLNNEDIIYVALAGIGESLINKNILLILDELKGFTGTWFILPTKGLSFLSDDVIKKIQELRDSGVNITLQLGLYSLREKVINKMYGIKNSKINFLSETIDSIKRMKKLKFDFCMELLLTKYSVDEVGVYEKFCKVLGVDCVIHRLHNFGGKLERYEELYVKGNTDPYYNYNGMCGFKPFFNRKGDVFPGSLCMHYELGNIDDYSDENGMTKILNECYDTIDMKNKFCSKCDDNLLNVRTKVIECNK
ncbi:MAG: radical SAM protein [Candidatus Gracilibacteria bacterium]|nr:radical SAM protein [Candidatus Gracilibacteria bacterium]